MQQIITIIAMIPHYFVAIQEPLITSAQENGAANPQSAYKKQLWGVQQLKTVNNHS